MGLGDRNTKNFHSKASQRKKKNSISRIMDGNVNWCDSNEGVANVAVSYFTKLYTTSHLSRITEVTNAILTRVSEEMNQDLIKEFTKEEDQRVHYGGS